MIPFSIGSFCWWINLYYWTQGVITVCTMCKRCYNCLISPFSVNIRNASIYCNCKWYLIYFVHPLVLKWTSIPCRCKRGGVSLNWLSTRLKGPFDSCIKPPQVISTSLVQHSVLYCNKALISKLILYIFYNLEGMMNIEDRLMKWLNCITTSLFRIN